jgi:hypothetical protein
MRHHCVAKLDETIRRFIAAPGTDVVTVSPIEPTGDKKPKTALNLRRLRVRGPTSSMRAGRFHP